MASETLLMAELTWSWADFTVDPWAWMPTVKVAISGFAATEPSPVTLKVSDLVVVTLVTEKGIGPAILVYKNKRIKKIKNGATNAAIGLIRNIILFIEDVVKFLKYPENFYYVIKFITC